jgi:cell wall-associated NlpC family hydrolase
MSFDRRITPFRPDLAAERLRGQVEAARYAPGTPRQVIASSAPLRRHPSPEAPLDTEALFGETVTVFDEHEGWSWVQLDGDGYVGYLPSVDLGPRGPEATHKVSAIRTFVYPGPNLKLPFSGFLSLNTRVSVTGTEGDYARLASGGFVFARHLSALDEAESDYVSVAERLLGVPYLWGGRTSLGLDCSGLVQTALAAAGIQAPRDSDMQERELGTPVEAGAALSGLRRGDLVFWKGHVGIMLDESRLLHANGHTMAVSAEPLAAAEERIRTRSFGPITAIKRL